MKRESSTHFAVFPEMRGSWFVLVPDLPCRDVSKSLFIAVYRVPGDDIGKALDFRKGAETDPSVIASDWSDGTCTWIESLRFAS